MRTTCAGTTAGRTKNVPVLELLAPAGSLQAFEAAVQAGADAVYIGAPELNARNLARHFSPAEITAMVDYAHHRGVRVYAAMNSLVKEQELGTALDTLWILDKIGIDALIVQDLGVARLARQFFPSLPLHASTLMTAHNSQSVRMLANLGFKRIVLARELTLGEIGEIAATCRDVELEVFVHGAMCFAYSGLCLFSSFLGGKSGLRGRCVQPCRRRYTTDTKGGGGYFFSMHDLEGISHLPQLQQAGIHSLKIEGRMRTADYVDRVVRAYRKVLDAPCDQEALRQARGLLEGALGRKSSSGFFLKQQPKNLLSPQHSGNTGIFLGKIEAVREQRVRLRLRHELSRGDRLRCHQEKSGERLAFTVKELFVGRTAAATAAGGRTVWLPVYGRAAKGDSLFLLDSAANRKSEANKKALRPERFARKAEQLRKQLDSQSLLQRFLQQLSPGSGEDGRGLGKKGHWKGSPGRPQSHKDFLPYYIRTDDPTTLGQRLAPRPRGYVLVLTRESLQRAGRGRLGVGRQQLVWALPPIIAEEDLSFYRLAVADLIAKGFMQWQISHVGQLLFFQECGKRQPILFGHHTLNVLNSASFLALNELGVMHIESAIETDRKNLFALSGRNRTKGVGVTVYGRPPLFISRLQDSSLPLGRQVVSPKKERFRVLRLFGQTVVVSTTTFCLLDRQQEMAAAGISYLVIDVCGMRLSRRDWQELSRLIRNESCGSHQISRFNYAGNLQ